MTDILSIVAVAGPFVGAGVGFGLRAYWQDLAIQRDNVVRRHLKTIKELRAEKDGFRVELFFERGKVERLTGEVAERDARIAILTEANRDMTEAAITFRDEMDKALVLAGKPDQQAISDRMREIGIKGNKSPKRKNRKAANDGQDAAA